MYKKIKLDNGLTLVLETEKNVRSVCIGVWVKIGSAFEKENEAGMSHFIEHMLFKGTKTHTARDIAETMDSIGGILNAFSAKEFTCYLTKVRDQHIETAISILSDMLLNSIFNIDEIEREKNVIIEEIKMYEDTPDELIHDLFSQALWQNHSLGKPILGTSKSVSAITREKIINYYSKYYVPSNIIITAVGNFKISEFTKLIKKYFKFNNQFNNENIINNLKKPKAYTKKLIFEKNVEQVHMIIGCPALDELDPNRYKLYVLNSILGGSMSSRLFQEIRENHGLAYSIFSYATLYKPAGLFGVYAGCGYNDCVKVAELILKEIEKIKTTEVTLKELKRTHEQLKGNIILALESINTKMNKLGRDEIYFERKLSVDELLEQIDKVTTNDILQLASQIFDRKNFSIVIIGPKDKDKKLACCLELI